MGTFHAKKSTIWGNSGDILGQILGSVLVNFGPHLVAARVQNRNFSGTQWSPCGEEWVCYWVSIGVMFGIGRSATLIELLWFNFQSSRQFCYLTTIAKMANNALRLCSVWWRVEPREVLSPSSLPWSSCSLVPKKNIKHDKKNRKHSLVSSISTCACWITWDYYVLTFTEDL